LRIAAHHKFRLGERTREQMWSLPLVHQMPKACLRVHGFHEMAVRRRHPHTFSGAFWFADIFQ